VVVRDRLSAPVSPLVAPSAVAVAAGAGLQVRRLLIEERTRRELLTLVGPQPLHPRPAPAPEPARQRSRRPDEEERTVVEAEAPGRRPGAVAAAQALDVERLTDQVVRRIDERLLAYRERLGRAF
jgi:hypothetical protein